jgi:hypothetical protein
MKTIKPESNPENTQVAGSMTRLVRLDWFLAGWLRALRVSPSMYPRHAAERIPVRHRIAVRRKIDALQCDNCGDKAAYYASHEEAGAVKICDGCRRSHWQENSNVRPILPNARAMTPGANGTPMPAKEQP